jgi:uncharacterized OsmC-like protein
MDNADIGKAIASVETYLQSHANPGPRADTTATATIVNGLKCRIESPDGNAIHTDMPPAIGGDATANSPGWHLRAALASCDATMVAMRAARLGLHLDSIEVRVDASSDGRGMFLDEGVSPGSAEMQLHFKIGRGDASVEQVEALVHWVEEHSPVGNDVMRAVKVSSKIEID